MASKSTGTVAAAAAPAAASAAAGAAPKVKLSLNGKGKGANDVTAELDALVKVKLETGDLVGRVYTHERGFLVLEVEKDYTTLKSTFRMINGAMIKGVEYLGPPRTDKPRPTPAVDMGKVAQREREAHAKAARARQRIGDGVSVEAQELFDALSKTAVCRWHDKTIILEALEVQVRPPYAPADVVGQTEAAVNRVKKMVAHIRGGR